MFSSRSFTISGLTFNTLIYFKLIFMRGIKRVIQFHSCGVVTQFSQLYFFFFFFLSFVFCLSRAIPEAYEGSQARGQIGAVNRQPTPQPRQCQIRAMSVTYTTAHVNTRSLTHQVRPGIKPASSQMPVRFVSTEPRWEFPQLSLLKRLSFSY